MAVRPELSLNVPTFELPNPLAQMAQVTQIQNALQQQRMGDIQMQNALREQQRKQGLEKLMSGFAPEAKTEDVASALQRGGYFTEAQTLIKSRAELEKERRQAEEARLKGMISQADIFGRVMGVLKKESTQEDYNFALNRLKNILTPEDVAQLGETFDYNRVRQFVDMTMSQRDRLEAAFKERTTVATETKAKAAASQAQTAAQKAQRDRVPMSVQEFEAFNRMTPDQQAAFTAFQATKRPTTTIQMPPGESAFSQKIGTGLGAKVVGDIDAASNAPNVAARANSVLAAVNENKAFMGPAADFKLQLARALNVTGKGPSEQIAATETLIADLKQSVIEAIKASNLGTGNGFTNKDLEFLVNAKAADIAKDPRTLQEFAERAYRTAQEAAKKGNARLAQNQQVRQQAGVEKFDIPEMVTVSRRSSVRRGAAPDAAPADEWKVIRVVPSAPQ